MSTDRHISRRQKLLQALRKAQVPALLVTNPKNVTYLTGVTGDDSSLLIGPEILQLFSDTRFETQLQTECPRFRSKSATQN
jgi:Xaa-Pro aminopeptidase